MGEKLIIVQAADGLVLPSRLVTYFLSFLCTSLFFGFGMAFLAFGLRLSDIQVFTYYFFCVWTSAHFSFHPSTPLQAFATVPNFSFSFRTPHPHPRGRRKWITPNSINIQININIKLLKSLRLGFSNFL